jgi:hypothetical protein
MPLTHLHGSAVAHSGYRLFCHRGFSAAAQHRHIFHHAEVSAIRRWQTGSFCVSLSQLITTVPAHRHGWRELNAFTVFRFIVSKLCKNCRDTSAAKTS